MDPRLYIYELRKPRVANPTFNSSHINSTCFSIYSGGPLQSSSLTQTIPPPSQNVASSQNIAHTERKTSSELKEEPRSRASSHLSNIGSSVLKLEDKDVYKKQTQKFNIISMEPVSHSETIKKYPKLTLEDKDAFYFRKMTQNQLQKQHQEQLNQSTVAKQEQTIAGVPTYNVDSNKVPLNLWESYGSGQQRQPRFTAGMLNHVDEFRSLI